MNPERFARVKEIVLTALSLPGSERERCLGELCGGDPDLRAEVEAILAHDGTDVTLVKTDSVRSLLETVTEERTRPSRSRVGERIGPYRLVGVLGQGGMGIVYHAVQVEPIARDVALKLVPRGLDSDSLRARFESERQVLARMDHPNIARVLDAGSDDGGRPFFVMELVRGVPITEYCRDNRLGVRKRLELFADVCRAIRHAHRQGVIHRDLKPSNVLVTVAQDRAQVKVIDFGIAKAVGEESSGAAHHTRTGQLVGTIEYMSPEQARGEVSSIDVRSDVFSLGVIAYELITDRRPFDLEGKPLHEAVRTICEQPEPRLRGTTTTATGRIEADLETIVGKCLAKDPDRRYGSAGDLTEDLERYLEDRPILARPATTLYQLRLFARRHKALCGALATVAVVLVGATIVSTALYLRAEAARVEASRKRDAAQAVTRYLTRMLGSANPRIARGREVTVREVLDNAAASVKQSFGGQDEVEASVRIALGSTYHSIGEFVKAEEQLLAALALRQRLYGDDAEDTLVALHRLVFLKWDQGDLGEAERLQRQIVEAQRRTIGPEHADTFQPLVQLGMILRDAGKNVEGVALFRPLVELGRKTRGPDDEGTLHAQYQLATLLGKQGQWAEAEQLHRQTLETRIRILGEDHPDTMWSRVLLAHTLLRTGRAAEAEPIVARACEDETRVLGKDHPDTLWCKNVRGEVSLDLGKVGEARTLFEEILETRRRVLGGDHRDTLWTTNNLADAYSRLGLHPEAEALSRQALEVRTRLLGIHHYDTVGSRGNLVRTLAVMGRTGEAQQLLRQNLASLETNVPELAIKHLEGSVRLTDAMIRVGRFSEAEPLLLLAHRRIVDGQDLPPDLRRKAVESLAGFYVAWSEAEPGRGHEEQLASLRAKLEEPAVTEGR